ncbi:hypothetical protein C0J52_13958 [Blattella germanica]|nr:hypothetical protein C0J52_13958 [Blattella germanica]
MQLKGLLVQGLLFTKREPRNFTINFKRSQSCVRNMKTPLHFHLISCKISPFLRSQTGKSEIFLYHEGVAHKGANDICSILLKYIDTNIPSSVKKLYFFSDDTGRFEQILHYFPVRGHSYLPNDRDFGTMKRMIRKHDPIYTPDEYEELCAQSSNNFHITKLLASDIKDFSGWWKEYYTKNPLARECRGRSVPKEAKYKFARTRYKEFRYNPEEKGYSQYTFSLKDYKSTAISC